MKSVSARLIPLLCAVLVVAVPHRLPAEEAAPDDAGAKKPAVVVSIRPLEHLLAGVAELLRAVEADDALAEFEFLTDTFTAGFDRSRPLGSLLYVQDDAPESLSFVPVTDFDTAMGTVQLMLGESLEEEGGVLRFVPENAEQPVYVKEHAGWAFVANTPQLLAVLPDDPVKLLGGAENEYDLAVRVFVQNISEELQKTGLGQIEGLAGGAGVGLDGAPGAAEELPEAVESEFEFEDPFAPLQDWLTGVVETIETVVRETEFITFGMNLETGPSALQIDLAYQALPGTNLAQTLEQFSQPRSNFSGFRSRAADVSLNVTFDMGEMLTQQLLEGLREQLSEEWMDEDAEMSEEMRQAEQAIQQALADLAEQSIKTGKIDAGFAMVFRPGASVMVGGAAGADAAAVRDAMLRLYRGIRAHPEMVAANIATEDYKGARFVILQDAQLALDDEEAREMFGEDPAIVLATRGKEFYFALGADAVSLLKRIFDRSEAGAQQVVTPFDLSLAMGALLQLAPQDADDEWSEEIVEKHLAASRGRDRIAIGLASVENGVALRLELEEFLLRMMVVSAMNNQEEETFEAFPP